MTDTKLNKELLEDGGWIRHYKGNVYFFHGVFVHSESGEPMGAYSDMKSAWVRPMAMFFDSVEFETRIEPRFRKALPAEIESHAKKVL